MSRKTRFLTNSAMIAAVYVVLTVMFQAISFGAVQVRISEALTILPVFTPAAIPGLFIGCLLGNIIGGAAIIDVIFGSVATLAGAIITYFLRGKGPVVASFGPVVCNTLVIPFVICYCYGTPYKMLPLLFLYLFIGEFLSCSILGYILHKVIKRSGVYKVLTEN